MGKGVVTDSEARETLVITRKTSERLFEFSFRYAERRRARGRPGRLACVDKGQCVQGLRVFPQAVRRMRRKHPSVATDRLYVDACSAMLVRRPWDFWM